MIENGYIRRANYELGSIYGFGAKVVHGSGRGKKLEFPTADLFYDKIQLMIQDSTISLIDSAKIFLSL